MAHLDRKITESRIDYLKTNWGMTADGYTKRSGAPTRLKIRLVGESRWRRLMIWRFSNSGTCFVRINGESFPVYNYEIPEPTNA